MIQSPECSFYISGNNQEILPGSPLWALPLSGRISQYDPSVQSQNSDIPGDLTIGDYFSACRTFLSADKGRILYSALSQTSQGKKGIKKISLFLIKHGAFYHPVKIDVDADDGGTVSFVLNGAVSDPGLALLKREYGLLAMLGEKNAGDLIPRVFGMGRFMEKGHEFGFFLGEWFQGFREFHITGSKEPRRIAVWEDSGNSSFLSLEQALPIYEQVAFILTSFYDLDTFEQIFPWHHAAGDFVADIEKPDLPVKLISVRGYGPLVEFPSDPTGQYVLPSLLFFFLNLSLRIRLDRLDGTGEAVFLDEPVLRACVKGFFKGLQDHENQHPDAPSGLDDPSGKRSPLAEGFVQFIRGFDAGTLEEIIGKMMDQWRPGASESDLINNCLESHCAAIHGIFKNSRAQDFY
ncbi:hypothetical protein [Desulfospira joergensenii]|uniref:hypothetical protein n=1 Tax=Desulfospira joergensenii TaxID=53329 RepID=UPI0003B4DDB9|nr:hypothetical protein [Desulfospira joergensenii]